MTIIKNLPSFFTDAITLQQEGCGFVSQQECGVCGLSRWLCLSGVCPAFALLVLAGDMVGCVIVNNDHNNFQVCQCVCVCVFACVC